MIEKNDVVTYDNKASIYHKLSGIVEETSPDHPTFREPVARVCFVGQGTVWVKVAHLRKVAARDAQPVVDKQEKLASLRRRRGLY
jgi:hypothetical protein